MPLISFSSQNTIGYRYLFSNSFFVASNLILTSICKRAGMPPFLCRPCATTRVKISASMKKKSQLFLKIPTSPLTTSNHTLKDMCWSKMSQHLKMSQLGDSKLDF